MSSRSSRLLTLFAALAVVFAGLVAARPAAAQDRRIETAAKDALKKARADFQSNDFDTGVVRLKKAIKACGTIRCTPSTRAQLLRDLGAMQFKRGDKAGASQSFAEAILTDPKVPLAPYDQPDLRVEWNATRDEAQAVTQSQPTGDFEVTSPLEQAVDTPLPIYVQYRGGSTLESVVVKYRGEGQEEWRKIDLVRRGNGWAGLVPCADVLRGVLRYYVQGIDASGTPSAMSGDPKRPFVVPIRHSISGRPPSLPGEAPPAKCAPGGQCPPEEPNCNQPPSGVSHAEEVPQCEDDSQCSSGVCEDGRCVEPKVASPRGYARWWVGAAGSVDITLVPSADDVCLLSTTALPLNAPGYYCTFPNGDDYPTRSSAKEDKSLVPGQAGHVDGGPSFAAVRVLLAVDYAFSAKVLAGIRAGYVAHSYPGVAARTDGFGFTRPFHLEARVTYLLGDEPLAHSGGLAPMLFGGLGIAEFAAEKDVMVRQSNPPLAVPGALPRQAWLLGGPFFVAVGAGGRYALSQQWAFTMAAKLSAAFGGTGFTPSLAPELGLQYGF